MTTYMSSHFGKEGLDPRPEELDRVSRVFLRYGGTWRGVFLGSTDALTRLKQVLKVAVKAGVFTKKPEWSK